MKVVESSSRAVNKTNKKFFTRFIKENKKKCVQSSLIRDAVSMQKQTKPSGKASICGSE